MSVLIGRLPQLNEWTGKITSTNNRERDNKDMSLQKKKVGKNLPVVYSPQKISSHQSSIDTRNLSCTT